MKFSLALIGLFAAIAMADDCQVGSIINEKEFRKNLFFLLRLLISETH